MINPLNVILLLIIVFVFFKLRGVLGMRNPEDNNHHQTPEAPPQTQTPDDPNTIDQEADASEPVSEPASEPAPEGGRGIALFRQLQPAFDEAQFLQGASHVYEMILLAFADDNLAPVKEFLGDDVYDGFAAAITQRQSAGKALRTQIINLQRPSLEDALIIEAGEKGEMGQQVQLEVRFRAEILSYLVDKADKAAEKDAPSSSGSLNPHISDDLWVFEQALEERGQKWRLVRTGD